MNSPLKFQPLPDLPPPSSVVGPVAWVRSNLLSSPFNMLLTAFVLVAYLADCPGNSQLGFDRRHLRRRHS